MMLPGLVYQKLTKMEQDLLILREFIDVLTSDDDNQQEEIQAEIDIMEAQVRAIESDWAN